MGAAYRVTWADASCHALVCHLAGVNIKKVAGSPLPMLDGDVAYLVGLADVKRNGVIQFNVTVSFNRKPELTSE